MYKAFFPKIDWSGANIWMLLVFCFFVPKLNYEYV